MRRSLARPRASCYETKAEAKIRRFHTLLALVAMLSLAGCRRGEAGAVVASEKADTDGVAQTEPEPEPEPEKTEVDLDAKAERAQRAADRKARLAKAKETRVTGGQDPGAPQSASARVTATAPPTSPPKPQPKLPRGNPAPSQLALSVIATMENEDPARSLATIGRGTGRTGVYAPGDEIVAGVRVEAIRTGVVYLDNQGRFEFIAVDATTSAPSLDDGTAQVTATSSVSPGAAIQCTGLQCSVNENVMRSIAANPVAFENTMKARPYKRSGLTGLRLSGIRNEMMAGQLGLRTGDVVTAINGTTVASLEDVRSLQDSLIGSSRVELDFVRADESGRTEHKLEIQAR